MTLPRVETKNGVSVARFIGALYQNQMTGGNQKEKGAIKIALPRSWDDTMYNVRVTGYHYDGVGPVPPASAWELIIGGYTYSFVKKWVSTSVACTTGNIPYDIVRFGEYEGKCCIFIGEENSLWSYPTIAVSVIASLRAFSGGEQWDVSIEEDLSGVTFSGGTHYANTPTPSIAHPAWYNTVLENGATGTIEYTKVGGICFVCGLVQINKSGQIPSITIATLPKEFRPANREWYSSYANMNENAVIHRVRILTTGKIEWGSDTGFVLPTANLCFNTSFIAEQ